MIENVKRAYLKPECGVVRTETETLLGQASGSAGTIGHGSSGGDAKQAPIWDDDENEGTTSWTSEK